MDRTISQEERIRRAEEIYKRRNQNKKYDFSPQYNVATKPIYKKAKKSMTKKLVIQSIVCLIIYFGVYFANGQENMKYVYDTVKENVNQDINIEILKYRIETAKKWLEEKVGMFIKENAEEPTTVIEENTVNEEQNEVSTDEVNNLQEEQNSEVQEVSQVEEPKSQEELDIEEAKSKNIIWPLNGVITSNFGPREATSIVSAYHHGLDIGGNEGDTIIAAMDGEVTVVSEDGDYGKHIKIENGDITTLYAHCSKLLVSSGTQVTKGEEIAKVGQTGKATRSTFAF